MVSLKFGSFVVRVDLGNCPKLSLEGCVHTVRMHMGRVWLFCARRSIMALSFVDEIFKREIWAAARQGRRITRACRASALAQRAESNAVQGNHNHSTTMSLSKNLSINSEANHILRMRRLVGRHFVVVVVVRADAIGRAVQRQQLATRPCKCSKRQVECRKDFNH